MPIIKRMEERKEKRIRGEGRKGKGSEKEEKEWEREEEGRRRKKGIGKVNRKMGKWGKGTIFRIPKI